MNVQNEIIEEEFEEGEVSNDSDNAYTPLERPDNYSNLKSDSRALQIDAEELESEDQSSDVESDSDSSGSQVKKNKKPKIKLKRKALPKVVSKKKKYDIWCTKVQEDVLSETLNNCDVTIKDRSRDVESYDHTRGLRYRRMADRPNNKRTMDDRRNVHLRLGTRNDLNEKHNKGKSRKILDLVTTLQNTAEEIARDIANKLYEQKEELILKVLSAIGKEKCFDIFKETKETEANGGMLIMNETRRRTPGGVFLYLVRCDESITRKQKDEIFNDERNKHKKNLKEKRRKKLQMLKQQTAAERAKLLPDILTRKDCLMENRCLKESDEDSVVNPPPTPETDGHEKSCDGIENLTNVRCKLESIENKDGLTSYDEDFLDLNCSNNDMDMF
ncbi:hypothetical protein WA026_015118 [Henosepilachna vigintioctopunctata]|uniref:Phosphorylated adapter RNA export protein n=1 Tax=Henosepilachna vigintioctopunctata TaxID=420089 RepID=A0AAW1TKR9_9CUCU